MAWFLRSPSLPFSTISFILFCSMVVSVSTADLFEEFKLPSEKKITHLHLYLHDIVTGRNVTTMRVVTANTSLPNSFGYVIVLDDPLTAGPSPTSKLVGRAQGFYAFASQEAQDPALALAMNLVFAEGEYEGSTLTILGRNPPLQTTREMPVVGGSGRFRLARGYAIAKTFFFNTTNGDTIVEYNLYVLHR